MKKFIKSIVSLGLVGVCMFAPIGCKKNSGDSGEDRPASNTSQNHQVNISTTSTLFFDNGVSEYKIVKPEVEDVYIEEAVSELNYILSLATGKELPVVTDGNLSWAETDKYISLGQTSILSQSGLSLGGTELGANDGFEIETEGKTVFIAGGSTSGTLFGVYKFLYYEVGFEAFSDSEITYNEAKTIPLLDFDVKEIPDIDQRIPCYYEITSGGAATTASHRMYANVTSDFLLTIDGIPQHNTLAAVPPAIYFEDHKDWYMQGATADMFDAGQHSTVQLCFSRDVEGLSKVVCDKLKEELVAQPYARNICFTQQDGGMWCYCDKCSEIINKYGSEAATQLLFDNVVIKELERWFAAPSGDPQGAYTDDYKAVYGIAGARDREVILTQFAYVKTKNPPVKTNDSGEIISTIDVELDDNLGVWIALIGSNFNYALNTEQNKTDRNIIEGWAKVVDNISYWGYSISEQNSFFPLNCMNAQQQSYKFVKEMGGTYIFEESQHYVANMADWNPLYAYVTANLMWDLDSHIPTLVDKFMKAYFGPAAEAMTEIFWNEQDWLAYCADILGRPGNPSNGSLGNAEYWPQALLLDFIEDIETAQNALVELKKTDPFRAQTILDRIVKEGTPFRYLLLKNYKNYYDANTFNEMKSELLSDVQRLGIGVYKSSDVLARAKYDASILVNNL